MAVSNPTARRGFAVWWKDIDRWSVKSLQGSSWQWSPTVIKKLAFALERRCEPVDKKAFELRPEHFLSLRFTGEVEQRDLHGKSEFKGSLYFARAGDIIYSKIDVRNGAIGIVPDDVPVATVTSEFPVYRINKDVATSEYIQLVFRTGHFRRIINGMVSGASGRKRVQPEDLESVEIPIPSLSRQNAIVAVWRRAIEEIKTAKLEVNKFIQSVDRMLKERSNLSAIDRRWLCVQWENLHRWDMKTARAAFFRQNNPSFRPMGEFVEEVTELVRPWQELGVKRASSDWLDKEWPVYGVNNKEGVFFSHYQKARDFNAPYKRIQKDWFFHNPTRSSVGSLGIVPKVPDDAITSPEYQVWRIKSGLVPSFVAAMISTDFFIKLIQFHRVGAVKQRLYVENLLEIPIPVVPLDQQKRIAEARKKVLEKVERGTPHLEGTRQEIEELILGTRTLEAK